MGAQAESDRAAAAVEEEAHGEAKKIRIDAATVPVRDRLWLVVGTLHEPDRRVQRTEALDVIGGPSQVGLQADAGPRVGRPQPFVEGDRRLDVVAPLHVDPQV